LQAQDYTDIIGCPFVLNNLIKINDEVEGINIRFLMGKLSHLHYTELNTRHFFLPYKLVLIIIISYRTVTMIDMRQ